MGGIMDAKKLRDGGKRKHQDSVDSDSENAALEEGDELGSESVDEEHDDLDEDWIPGQDVEINYKEVLEILTSSLDSPLEEDCLLESLRWIVEFLDICPEEVLPFTPKILAHMLPAMASTNEIIYQAATRVNSCLMDYVASLSDDPGTKGNLSGQGQVDSAQSTSRLPLPGERAEGASSNRASLASSRDLEAPSPSPANQQNRSMSTPTGINFDQQQTDLDYGAAVS